MKQRAVGQFRQRVVERLNDVNPHVYLSDLIERLVAGHLQSRIDELMPWSYRDAPAV